MLLSILWKLIGVVGGAGFDKLLRGMVELLQKQASDDLARFQAGAAADTQIALSRLQAEIETRKVQAQIVEADRGWWVTSWVRPLIVYPCVLHFGAILLDSTFHFGWAIAKLPPPYDGYEQIIILSFFIARPFEKAARVFAAGRG